MNNAPTDPGAKRYNIVLLPNMVVADKAFHLSQRLPGEKLFTLGAESNLPHVSMFMVHLYPHDLPAVARELRDLATKTPPISLVATGFSMSFGFSDVEYRKDPGIVNLQHEVVKAVNPFRRGMDANNAQRMTQASGVQRENLQNFGWASIGELYRPHLTFTAYKQDVELPIIMHHVEFSGDFPYLAIVEWGNYGVAAQLLASYALGAQ